jgi:DNA ligase (NAD+)
MDAARPIEELSPEAAQAELTELARLLDVANRAYYQGDAPVMSDAEYDALKRRNAALEAAFPSSSAPTARPSRSAPRRPRPSPR